MERLFLIVYIIGIVISIFSIVKLKKVNDSKYWNIFIGITVANIISTVLAYNVFSNNALGLGGAIVCLFICGFSIISNIILFVVGLIIKKSIKFDNVKLNKNSLFTSVLVILLNVIILFILPIIISNITLKLGEKRVVNYLKNKYGNSNYKVVNVYKEYSNIGMFDRYLSGYYYEIKSDYMKDTFIVSIDDNLNYIEYDYFLPVYFSQKYHLKYNLNYDVWHKSLYYDFSEFDNYIQENINEQNLIDLFWQGILEK